METQAATGRSEPARQRSIDSDRFERALTEPRAVTFTAPGVAEVAQGITTYEADLGDGSCTCDDYRFRGDEHVCKHVIRAALAALLDENQRNSELVGRVAAFAREAGCPHGIEACNGPTCGADRPDGLPCQGCVEAVKSDSVDEWAVWNAPGARARRTDRVVTDGGHVETVDGDRDDDAPETCDHCGEPPELTLSDVSGSDWNDFEQLCTTCVLDVGGPGEVPDGHNSDGDEAGTVDVSPCPGCGAPTTGDTCGRARCEGADEIDEATL